MIDLTPLDVRNKRGDFKKTVRGYDTQEVDAFLEIAAERLEVLVRENLQFRDRTQTLQEQVSALNAREQAVQDALVTAQELRADIQAQSQREAGHALRDAEVDARRLIAEAEAEVRALLRGNERRVDHAKDTLQEFERRRKRFLSEFRQLLEREIYVVEVEEGRSPLEERAIDMDLGGSRSAGARREAEPESDSSDPPVGSDGPQDGGGAEAAGIDEDEADPFAEHDAESPAAEAAASDEEVESDSPADPEAHVTASAEPESSTSLGLDLEEPASPALVDAEPSVASAPEPDPEPDTDGLTATLEAEAFAEARTQVQLEAQIGPIGASLVGNRSADFAGVPDLETVLAEAGAADVTRPEVTPPPAEGDAAPPPVPGRSEESLLLYPDSDEQGRKR